MKKSSDKPIKGQIQPIITSHDTIEKKIIAVQLKITLFKKLGMYLLPRLESLPPRREDLSS